MSEENSHKIHGLMVGIVIGIGIGMLIASYIEWPLHHLALQTIAEKCEGQQYKLEVHDVKVVLYCLDEDLNWNKP